MTIAYKWLVLFTVAIGAFVVTLDTSIINVSLPSLSKDMGVEPSVVMWVTVVYLLISVSLMLTVGKIGDVLGRKRIYAIGFAVFTAGLTLCSLSSSITELILSRIVQGTGAAMIVSLGIAILVSAFPAKELGRALGMFVAVVSAGLLAGPVLGGVLLDIFDWRAIFYTRIPIGIIGTIMALTFLKDDKRHGNKFQFDWLGAVVLFCLLSCLLAFVNLGGKFGYRSPLVLTVAGLNVILMVLFVVQERSAQEPTVDLNLFKNPIFTGGNINLSIMFFALGSYTFLMPFYLIDGLGHSSTQTGLLIAVASLASLVISPISGWLSDKIGYRPLCAAGIALMTMALYSISQLDIGSSDNDIVIKLIMFGTGVGLFQSPNNSAIMGSSPESRLGTTSAMIATIRQVSIALGVTLSATVFADYQAIFAVQSAHKALPPLVIGKLALITSFQNTMFIAAIICGIGIFTSVIQPKKIQRIKG